MNDKFLIIFILFLLIGCEIGAEFSITKYSRNKNIYFLVLGVSLYVAIPFLFWWMIEETRNISVYNTIWQAMNIVIVAIIGIIIFQDKLSVYQKIGIGLAILSSVLMFFN